MRGRGDQPHLMDGPIMMMLLLQLSDKSELDNLMDAAAYKNFCDSKK